MDTPKLVKNVDDAFFLATIENQIRDVFGPFGLSPFDAVQGLQEIIDFVGENLLGYVNNYDNQPIRLEYLKKLVYDLATNSSIYVIWQKMSDSYQKEIEMFEKFLKNMKFLSEDLFALRNRTVDFYLANFEQELFVSYWLDVLSKYPLNES